MQEKILQNFSQNKCRTHLEPESPSVMKRVYYPQVHSLKQTGVNYANWLQLLPNFNCFLILISLKIPFLIFIYPHSLSF